VFQPGLCAKSKVQGIKKSAYVALQCGKQQRTVLMIRYYNLIRNLSNWWLYVAFKCGAVDVEPLVFRTRNGIVIQVPQRLLHTFKEIFMDECYVRDLDPHVPETPTIIDVGANVGYFSLFAVSRFANARIFSFEPLPSNFRLLDTHRRLNARWRLTCLEKAVAGHDGVITLSYNANDSFSTSATLRGTSGENQETIDVSCVTLQDVFEEFDLNTCDLLKMDCEGAEFDILYNCPSEYLRRVKRITMEVHADATPGHTIEALEEYLKDHGFVLRRRPVGMLWATRVG